jgi:hypothetical protein
MAQRSKAVDWGALGNVGNYHVVLRFFLFKGPCVGNDKRGNASVGWPSSDGRRPLPSLHHRPVRFPAQLDRVSLSAEPSLSLVLSYSMF